MTLYITLYSPTFDVSTVFSNISILSVISPSSSSYALTPDIGSNLSPTFNSISSDFISGTLFLNSKSPFDKSLLFLEYK